MLSIFVFAAFLFCYLLSRFDPFHVAVFFYLSLSLPFSFSRCRFAHHFSRSAVCFHVHVMFCIAIVAAAGLSSDDSHSLSIGSVTGGPSGAALIGSAPSYSLVGHNNEDDASESDGGSKPPHWWPQQPKSAGGSRPGSASGRGSASDLPRKSSYSPPTTTDSSADEIIDFVNRGK
jgi:hypothetical protein